MSYDPRFSNSEWEYYINKKKREKNCQKHSFVYDHRVEGMRVCSNCGKTQKAKWEDVK